MRSENKLKDLYQQLLRAQKRKVARRIWNEIRKRLRDPELSPQERREVYVCLREELRAMVIDHTDSKYSAAPHMFPKRLLAFLNILIEIRALTARSVFRPGELELTMELIPLFKALEHCDTEEQVCQTFKMLKGRIDALPDDAREACYVRLLRVTEDLILTEYFRFYPHDRDAGWHDHLIVSLLATVDASAYGQYVLDFTFFDGDRFVSIDSDALISCWKHESLLKEYIKTLHSGLRNVPADFGGYILSRVVSDLPAAIVQQIRESGVQLDDTSAFLADILSDIDSGEIYVGMRGTGGAGAAGELEDILVCMTIACELAVLALPVDLKSSWERFLRHLSLCPQQAELLARHASLVVSASLFSVVVGQCKDALHPATLMLMRFFLAASKGIGCSCDEVQQAWVLDEGAARIGGEKDV